MPSCLLPKLSLSLGFLLGYLVYSRCVLGAAVAWSSALWFLAAKEALWLDHSKSLYFKLPNTLGLRRLAEDFYNLRPVFSFVFHAFNDISQLYFISAYVYSYASKTVLITVALYCMLKSGNQSFNVILIFKDYFEPLGTACELDDWVFHFSIKKYC